jgi:1,4-alpha-glucan branching enzyme
MRTDLALVLHAHLPFVRHPEHERSLEERWLFEAILECYLPLLEVFDTLSAEGTPFRLTMSITPPLAAMLKDELLRHRFGLYLARLESLAEREMVRLYGDAEFAPVATWYRERFRTLRAVWERYQGDVVAGFRSHWDRGNLELIACSATHAYLPGLVPTPAGIRAQLRLGMQAFASWVGRPAHGIWLPECAYHPTFDAELPKAGVKYTILDGHGVRDASPRPSLRGYAPIVSPGGVVFFGRDAASSEQVWSRESGYPGDYYYREFYRDIGFDLPESELQGEVGPFGTRVMTGLKYYRITGKGDDKAAYQPGIAEERARAHARDFVARRAEQARRTGAPVILAPYDAELYGHWWFEGPLFIREIFRELAKNPHAQSVLRVATLGEYMQDAPVVERAVPAPSSWGESGYGEVWVGPRSGRLWRHVHHATRYTEWLVRRHADATGDDNFRSVALDQVIRELLLLQSSDWAFILHTGTSTGYADARVRAHVHRLRHLGHLIEQNDASEESWRYVRDVASRDNYLAHFSSATLRAPFLE